jgi:hypothetical protein
LAARDLSGFSSHPVRRSKPTTSVRSRIWGGYFRHWYPNRVEAGSNTDLWVEANGICLAFAFVEDGELFLVEAIDAMCTYFVQDAIDLGLTGTFSFR